MLYWPTVILTVHNYGYYNKHHITYLCYTVTITDIIYLIYVALLLLQISYNLFMLYWPTVILTVHNYGYNNRHHTTYLCYTVTKTDII